MKPKPEVPWDGSSPKRCKCGARSVTGLKPGIALCRYHFCDRIWWKGYADSLYPEHPEARKT